MLTNNPGNATQNTGMDAGDNMAPSMMAQPRRQNNDSKIANHTVFIYNCPYNLPKNELENYIKSFGEVLNFYPQIETKGQAFVTYYDLRSSEKLVKDAKTKQLGDRQIHANYAFKTHRSKKNPEESCDSVWVYVTLPSDVTTENLKMNMESFGDIRKIDPVSSNDARFNIFRVRFYDTRSANKAYETKSINIQGVICYIILDQNDEEFEDKESMGDSSPQMAQNNA